MIFRLELKGLKQNAAPRISFSKAYRHDGLRQTAMFSAHCRPNSTCKESFSRHCSADRHSIFLLLAALLLLIFFSLSPTVAQSSSTDGESNILIDLPAEQVFNVVVTESLPIGLIYFPESLAITGASTNPEVTLSGSNDGSSALTITWSFGNMNNSANQDIQIRFRTVVANLDSNQNGALLAPESATLSWKDTLGNIHRSSDQSPSIKVIEPDLQIKRQFSPSSGWRGDTVSCTLNVLHSLSSTANAYDVDIQESLPQGLIYVPGSLEIVNGPAGTKDGSNGFHWHFSQVDQSWSGDQKIQLRYKATIDPQVHSSDSLECRATLDWTSAPGENPEARQYSKTSEDRILLTTSPPAFNLSLAAYPSPVHPGGDLTYTIRYKNRGGDAQASFVQMSYDVNVQFVSSDPAPDQGTNNRWTLGDMLNGTSGAIKVTVRAGSSLPDGTLLQGSATISCQQGASAQDTVFTKVLSIAPSLLIEKTASNKFIRPGGTLDYNISYQNTGNDQATNVTITDIVDSHLQFDPANCKPQPSKIWTESDGTHLWWNASVLKSGIFLPGDNGQIDLQVSLPSIPEHPNYDWVHNNYKIDSNESQGSFKTLQTAVIHSLYIRKTVEKQVYSTGDIVNYTLLYGNDVAAVDAENAVITDVLPDANYMEYEGAEPSPTSVQGNVLVWNIGKIPAKSSGTIYVYAKMVDNHSDIKFKSTGSVSGQGFVNFHQRLDTAEKPDRLTNYANITASYLGVPESDESSATIMLADALGTAVSIVGHGSGTYSREEESLLLSKNKTIQVKTSLKEGYRPSTFSLPQGRSINYDSKWSEAQSAKNRVTGASLIEHYMYARKIDRNSILSLDENGSTLASETSFEGAGHVGMLKRSDVNATYPSQEAPTYESQEDYLGSFNVSTKFDEYGTNVESSRSASGVGYAASDKRIGTSQRSYGSGTGNYQAEDNIQTQTNYVAKDINASYGSMRYNYTPDVNVHLSQKWSEGIWSKSGTLPIKGLTSSEPASFIGEEFSQADYLKENTTAKGLNEMDTEAEFSGRAQFKSQYINYSANQTKNELSLYDEYIGKYKIDRKLTLSGVARFDEPHLSISKVGSMDPAGGSFINYVITVINDGNRALGPVYVLDLFPPSTEYVYSSLRPSELASNSAQWTLVYLGIGSSSTINLKLNATEDQDNLVNRVQARGGYNNEWVSAENYSALQLNWLSCCPPQLRASKTGYVDANDSMLVHYRIALKNRESYIMAATVNDDLPDGMMFINSTVQPSDYSSDHARWNIIDLKPGEVKVIDYLARALQNGVFVNQAHIDTASVDGSDGAFADVSCQVQIGSTFNSGSNSSWQPPACFGLNCTQQDYGDEWLPCDACGTAEPQPLDTSCASCVPAVDGDSDVP